MQIVPPRPWSAAEAWRRPWASTVSRVENSTKPPSPWPSAPLLTSCWARVVPVWMALTPQGPPRTVVAVVPLAAISAGAPPHHSAAPDQQRQCGDGAAVPGAAIRSSRAGDVRRARGLKARSPNAASAEKGAGCASALAGTASPCEPEHSCPLAPGDQPSRQHADGLVHRQHLARDRPAAEAGAVHQPLRRGRLRQEQERPRSTHIPTQGPRGPFSPHLSLGPRRANRPSTRCPNDQSHTEGRATRAPPVAGASLESLSWRLGGPRVAHPFHDHLRV